MYCWKGLRFSARQDLEGFSRFTEYGIERVVPPELLPPEVRSKYQGKTSDRSKRAKKDETKGAHLGEEQQIATPAGEGDEGGRHDTEAAPASMDMEGIAVAGNTSRGSTPTPEDDQRRRSETPDDREPGQLEPDGETEPEADP
ncbi:hypothetical protein Droror1_Dr00022334 [Drosera rotundifolia]